MEPIRVASDEEFATVVENPNIQSSVIVGQVMLEKVLELLISEVMAERHYVDLARVPFPLKLDLAIALRLLPLESRPAFLKVNKLRNSFAHDWNATFGDREVKDIRNCLSPHHQQVLDQLCSETPRTLSAKEMLESIMWLLFWQLQNAVTRTRDQKDYSVIAQEVVSEVVANLRKSRVGLPKSRASHEIEQRVMEAKKKRQAAGKL